MSARPTPKKIILGLLLARRNQPLSAKVAIRACALFDLTENNVRVTLVRLSADGLIQSPKRGLYVLGPVAEKTALDVSGWRQASERLQAWNRGWIMLLTQPLLGSAERGDRKRWRSALSMLGMRELEAGVWLRPDNFRDGSEAVRERSVRLGLPRQALVFHASHMDDATQKRAEGLWDVHELEEGYREQTVFLKKWLSGWEQMDPEQAARESYLYGTTAIRRLVFDPWLPEEMVDSPARARYFETVREFDSTGQEIWRRVFKSDGAMPVDTSSSKSS